MIGPPGAQVGLLDEVLGVVDRAGHPVAVREQLTAERIGHPREVGRFGRSGGCRRAGRALGPDAHAGPPSSVLTLERQTAAHQDRPDGCPELIGEPAGRSEQAAERPGGPDEVALDHLALGVVEGGVHLGQPAEHRQQVTEHLLAGGVGDQQLGATPVAGAGSAGDVAARGQPVGDAGGGSGRDAEQPGQLGRTQGAVDQVLEGGQLGAAQPGAVGDGGRTSPAMSTSRSAVSVAVCVAPRNVTRWPARAGWRPPSSFARFLPESLTNSNYHPATARRSVTTCEPSPP